MLSRNAPSLLGRAVAFSLQRSAIAEPAVVAGFKQIHSDQGSFLGDSRKEEKQPSSQTGPGRLPLTLQALLPVRKTMKRVAPFSFANMSGRPYSTEVETKADKPITFAQHLPGTNVTPYLAGLVFLHVMWTMGGVDWLVNLNTSFVQSAVWVTALSLISPAAIFTALKRHVHVEGESTQRGPQTSSAVKVI